MSAIKKTLEITSPSFALSHNHIEYIKVEDIICKHCQGNGGFIGGVGRVKELIKCQNCGGTGKLNAQIAITWEKKLCK